MQLQAAHSMVTGISPIDAKELLATTAALQVQAFLVH